MRYFVSMFCALALVVGFSSNSVAKERRDRDQPASKVYVTNCAESQHGRHHTMQTAQRQHHRQQKTIARLEQRLEKKQRRIDRQHRKLDRLLAQRYNRQHHNDWPYNRYERREHHQTQLIVPVLPAPRIVIHFPW